MEPVRPSTGAAGPQPVAKVTPIGRGWMLLAVEAGFVLRNAAQGVDLRLAPEEAEALRRGEIMPEALAARAAPAPHPPPGAVTVAFSAEAMRLSGRMGAGNTGAGRAGASGTPAAQGRARSRNLPLPVGWIGAGCLALLVLVLIWT